MTQIGVSFSLTVVKQDANNSQVFIIPLLTLTWLLMSFWQVSQLVLSINWLIDISYKIFSIGFNSIVWGLT